MADRKFSHNLVSRILLTGDSMLIVVVTWFISARHWFHGPVINIEVPIAHIHTSRNNAHHLSMLCTGGAPLRVLRVCSAALVVIPLASTRKPKNSLPVWLPQKPNRSSWRMIDSVYLLAMNFVHSGCLIPVLLLDNPVFRGIAKLPKLLLNQLPSQYMKLAPWQRKFKSSVVVERSGREQS
jgi:hypothetical protein